MAPVDVPDGICSATYSNVPVFEFKVGTNHVMRRRGDDFINATHILKVADYDKPARTRILEREVQKGHHEKIQGGYGKYQGTWIPLEDGRALAERNKVLQQLLPIFDYIPGDVTPPQAPKHTTNANRVSKVPKSQGAIRKVPRPKVKPTYSQISEEYDNFSNHYHDEESQDNSTVDTASFMDGEDGYGNPYHGSRKRKRGHQDFVDQQHTMYADALLDYFILSSSEVSALQNNTAPLPPDNFQVDRPIDDQGHTAIHWGAAMGDLDVVKHFLNRNASAAARNNRGETPLIRAVLFTNNYEKETMARLVGLLLSTLRDHDNHGANVLHHIVMTTNSHAKRKCARYYLEIILHKLADVCTPHELLHILNYQDHDGDTPLHIAARHNARKCVRALQGVGVRGDIMNHRGETADQILRSQGNIHQNFASSSPIFPHADLPNGNHESLKVAKIARPESVNPYHTQCARSFSQSFEPAVQEKSLQLALALDSEFQEKEDDLTDSQRMLERVEKERSGVRQAMFNAFSQTNNDTDEQVRQMEEEERLLKAEGLALSEQLQHKELHQLVRMEEKKVPKEFHQRPKISADQTDQRWMEDTWRVALELESEQHKRRRLTADVVNAQGLAGMSQTGEALKKLVSSSMDIPVDQVTDLVPELLEELESAKMDVGSNLLAVA